MLASQFKRKEQVAWRVRVLDAEGKPVDDKGLKSLVVELADGKRFDLKYKGHPPRPPQTDYSRPDHGSSPMTSRPNP